MTYTPFPDSIGYVVYGDGNFIAEMRAFNDWLVTWKGRESVAMSRLLEQTYGDQFNGPQYGPVGLAALNDLAEKLHGKAVYLLPIEDPDPNVVY